MKTLSIDIETYSDVPLQKTGVYRYVESPDFEILLFAYSIDSQPVQVIDLACGEQIPKEILLALEDECVIKWAFNATFERICLSRFLGYPTGEYLKPENWRCSMIWSATMGLPLSFEGVGAVLGLEKQKLSEGKDLIKYFCQPCAPTKANGQRTRNRPFHAPDKWAMFKKYNIRDVETEMGIQQRLARFPVLAQVWEEYHLDQEINDRGVRLDMDLVAAAIDMDTRSRNELTNNMKEITKLENPNSVQQMKAWLSDNGLETDTLGKKAVTDLLKTAPPKLAQVLTLRQQLAKSSVRKYQAMEKTVCDDGRARGMFQFYGANRTGRFSGRNIQLQNLPQNHLSDLTEANRMIDDCKAGNIDMIITKSISRFARNTLDCLKYIRQLKDMNIPVLFEKESINTMDAKGEVLITIMASLAQQESQSLSQNGKMGLQYRYQQGKVQINHNRFLGYAKDADGNLVIDPEQAETLKRIYREYLEGLSMDKIAAGLERDGILTDAGGKKWHTSTINKILRNEKYIGDALLQKTYTTDFLNKTRVKNNGLVPQYYVEGDHEAIIPKDIYLQVQEELVRRRVVKTSANGKKRSYSCNHCFSQIVICGECGEMFRRLHWNNRDVKSIVWRCISRLESTGLECHARTINELVLQDAVVKAINQMLGDKSSYQAQLQLNIAVVIRASQATAIDSIDEKLMALQQELIQKANSKEDYDEIADAIFRLRELRQKTTVDTAARDEQIKRINDLQDYISQQTALLTEFDEALVRRWVEQITI